MHFIVMFLAADCLQLLSAQQSRPACAVFSTETPCFSLIPRPYFPPWPQEFHTPCFPQTWETRTREIIPGSRSRVFTFAVSQSEAMSTMVILHEGLMIFPAQCKRLELCRLLVARVGHVEVLGEVLTCINVKSFHWASSISKETGTSSTYF